jgi:hypothetical protein
VLPLSWWPDSTTHARRVEKFQYDHGRSFLAENCV